MQVNVLQKWWLIFRIAAISAGSGLRMICFPPFFKNKQKYSDDVIRDWAQRLLSLMRIKCRVFNPENFEFSANRPYIIMSNHISHFDIPLIYAAFPRASIRMIAKKELFYIPIFGWGMKIAGCLSIDRKNKRQAIKDLELAKKAMLEGIQVWISPEGTRSTTGELSVFKKGGFKIAIEVEAIIVPVTINGSNKILPAKTFKLSTDEEVMIYIGKPIDVLEYAQNLSKLINDVQNEIRQNLG